MPTKHLNPASLFASVEHGFSRALRNEQKSVVRFTTLFIACFVALTVVGTIAQTGAETKDPVTGKWGFDGRINLDLKFDGKSTVSGTTIWYQRNSYEHRAAIKAGRFDAKTGALKLEGEGTRPDGVVVVYVIEGKIEKDTVTGTFTFGDDGGAFTFKRL